MANSSENEETISNNNGEESNRPACAACKHQRKKCKKGCPFLVHFPAHKHQEFSAVHKIFGIANMSKMIKDIDFVKQGEVMDSIIWEAMVWTNKDHKEHGPYGLYKRLQEENKQLKEKLLIKSHEQELQFQPKSPGVVSKSCILGQNCSTDVKVLSEADNYPGCSHDRNDNLLLNSSVNSYRSLLEGYGDETQESKPLELGFPGTCNSYSASPGLGFRRLPRPDFYVPHEQEHQMREGHQERGHHHAVLPARPQEAIMAQCIRAVTPGQVKRSNQLENMNISNCSDHPRASSSLESRRSIRYHPYPMPQHSYSSMQNVNPPQRGLSQQYLLVNSSMQSNPAQRGFSQQYPLANSIQNNAAEQYNEVKSKTKEEDNTN